MKQRESYQVPRSSWKHGDHGAPPLLLSEIMSKHDEDGGDIGEKNIDRQLGSVHIDSTQRPIKKHIRTKKNLLSACALFSGLQNNSQ